MGNLPQHRVQCNKPFDHVGIDYAGPLRIKDYRGRGSKTRKAYICIFVCCSIKAIHLELVTDLTTETFLASFGRFISRRGKPSNVYSDNGTNFVGANNELKCLYNLLAQNHDTIAILWLMKKLLGTSRLLLLHILVAYGNGAWDRRNFTLSAS